MKRLNGSYIFFIIFAIFFTPLFGFAESDFLNKEENLWLKSRNNTIVVYPEKNFPPYSYQNSSGSPQGLSIDYIELIAQKIGAKVVYLPSRSRAQIIDDVSASKKGDVITSLTDTKEREDILYFTDVYVTSPAVIVVRKDLDKGKNITLNELTGKKVAIGSKYAVEEFVRTNNPRVVIESVVDDESGLQQVLLGEVDAAIMDITSLSFYLSKQVLSSVKIAGNTGFEYKLAFAVPKDKEVLQSILDKGLQQISTNDRKLLADKWVALPDEQNKNKSFISSLFVDPNTIIIYTLVCFIIIILITKGKRRSYFLHRFKPKNEKIGELKEEISELENASHGLVEELEQIKSLEQDIKNKIKDIEK